MERTYQKEMELRFESKGYGVTRIHARNVGFADVAAVYSAKENGWDVEVLSTNVPHYSSLERMIDEFRRAEGLL